MAWDRIRGHSDAQQQLFSAFHRGRLAHAYLFLGPDGTGKKAFAVEFAKALLCEHPPAELTACDHCPACAQVTAGTHPDLTLARKPEDKLEFVIDAMRALCLQLGLKPSRGVRKIAIIEDVDDFNEECSFDLPEGDWDSVGGLVFSELGRVPEVGDTVEVDGARLVVERMEGRRVGTLRIHRLAPTEASGPEAEQPADA